MVVCRRRRRRAIREVVRVQACARRRLARQLLRLRVIAPISFRSKIRLKALAKDELGY